MVSAHSNYAAREAEQLLSPAAPVSVVPHGGYTDVYPAPRESREQTRRRLGLAPDAFVYLMFGTVRDYKRVPEAIRAFRQAGARPWCAPADGRRRRASPREAIERAADDDPRVRLENSQNRSLSPRSPRSSGPPTRSCSTTRKCFRAGRCCWRSRSGYRWSRRRRGARPSWRRRPHRSRSLRVASKRRWPRHATTITAVGRRRWLLRTWRAGATRRHFFRTSTGERRCAAIRIQFRRWRGYQPTGSRRGGAVLRLPRAAGSAAWAAGEVAPRSGRHAHGG